ncbi:MAG: SPOR domain-containing protein [Gluconacetobacter diazotrophicus]|nr:SPOR domain-containing protein [Gluconacetobacter diazotrophicus]
MPLARFSAHVAALLAAVGSVAGCHHPAPAPAPPSAVHYVLGPSWQGDRGTWFYPREQPGFRASGLATVDGVPAGTTTADGERADPRAMTAAMQTLPLPAVVSVRNLLDGRTLLVRVTGRGPPDPKRLIALSPAAAALLGASPGRPIPVEVVVDEARTRAALDCAAGQPSLALAAAPVQAVAEQALPPPGTANAASGAPATNAGAGSGEGVATRDCAAVLPAAVSAGLPSPVSLLIDAGSFSGAQAANAQAARVGGRVERVGTGRAATWAVRLGPFPDVPAADAALDRLASAGVTGARITIE